MSKIRLGFAVATAGLALLAGTADAITCPAGTRPQVVCVNHACTVVCVPILTDIAA